LIRLEALQSVGRVIFPLTIGVAVKVASVRKRFLDFGIALRIGMKLVTGTGSLAG
jgi:hypothetical protein